MILIKLFQNSSLTSTVTVYEDCWISNFFVISTPCDQVMFDINICHKSTLKFSKRILAILSDSRYPRIQTNRNSDSL